MRPSLYTEAAPRRNIVLQAETADLHHQQLDVVVDLTVGGNAIRKRRPNWSPSVCNCIADAAGLGLVVEG